MYKDKSYDDVKIMSKEEAAKEIRDFFKGNRKFIEQAIFLIYSSHHFERISTMKFTKDTLNWEKLLSIMIDTKTGFKHFCYLKGNKKFAPNAERKGTNTYNIDEFTLTIYHSQNQSKEEFKF